MTGKRNSQPPDVDFGPVAVALQSRQSVIPMGRNKRPLVEWKKYQTEWTAPAVVGSWLQEFGRQIGGWARITGEQSGVVVLDFDREAVPLMNRLGLRPHVRTGSGGYHWIGKHPGWRVKTINSKSGKEHWRQYPNVDIRADGGYSLIAGYNEKGGYTWLRDPEPDPLDVLPHGVLEFFGLDRPRAKEPARSKRPKAPSSRAGTARPVAEVDFTEDQESMIGELLDRALGKVRGGHGRNESGFGLALQLRDHEFGEEEALAVGLRYVERVPGTNAKGDPEDYTMGEFAESLKSAYTQEPREPWLFSNIEINLDWGTGMEQERGAGPAEEPAADDETLAEAPCACCGVLLDWRELRWLIGSDEITLKCETCIGGKCGCQEDSTDHSGPEREPQGEKEQAGSHNRILTHEEARRFAYPAWSWDGIYRVGADHILFSPTSHGKTTLAAGLVVAKLFERPFLGRSVRPGSVFYWAAEDFVGVRERIDAYLLHQGLKWKDRKHELHYLRDGENFSAKEVRAELVKVLRGLEKQPSSFFLDNLGCCFGSGSMIEQPDTTAYWDSVKAFKRELGWKDFEFHTIHHSAVGSVRPFGSSVSDNRIDAGCRLEKHEGTDRVTVHSFKQRQGKQFAPFDLMFVDVPGSEQGVLVPYVEDRSPIGIALEWIKLTIQQRAILKAAYRDGTGGEWRRCDLLRAANQPPRERVTARALDNLERGGSLKVRRGEGRECFYQITPKGRELYEGRGEP